MPRVVDLECPECGARLAAPAGSNVVTCQYCNAELEVERNRAPVEPAKPVADAPAQPAAPDRDSQITSKRGNAAAVAVVFGLPIIAAVVIGYFDCRSRRKTKQRIAEAQRKVAKDRRAREKRYVWEAYTGKPMLVDVNGDGTTDVIGRIRYAHKKPATAFAAFDGKTGALLWQTPLLDSKNLSEARAAVIGNVMLLGDNLGAITAFELADGTQLWRRTVGERMWRICANKSGQALVMTKDERWHKVTVADGSISDARSASHYDCVWVPSNERRRPERGIHFARESVRGGGKRISRLPGMYVQKVYVRDADGVSIAVGNRSPGTNVPMLARFEVNDGQAQPLWKADAPGVAALEATPSVLERIGIGQTVVVVPYELRDSSVRVAAFVLSDGKRLWDVALPKPKRGSSHAKYVAVSKTRAFVAITEHLVVLDLVDGKVAFVVGTGS